MVSVTVSVCTGAFVGERTVIPLIPRRRPQITVFEVPRALDKVRTSARCAEELRRILSKGAAVSGTVSRRNHCVQLCMMVLI